MTTTVSQRQFSRPGTFYGVTLLTSPNLEQINVLHIKFSFPVTQILICSRGNKNYGVYPWCYILFFKLNDLSSFMAANYVCGGPRLTLSMELSELLDVFPDVTLTRLQIVTRLWKYLTEHNLQDPKNKLWFTPDQRMAPIFGSEKIKCFGMDNYLKGHVV